MKKTLRISIYLLIIVCLTSCGTTYKIQKDEYRYIPYNGKEVLIFESNTGKTDTIVLKKYSGWNRPTRYPYRAPFQKYEKYGIELTQKGTKTTDSIPNFVIGLLAFDWKGLRIDLRTKSDNHNYINRTSFTVSEFDSIPSIKMRINEIEYSDVKTILGENYKSENKRKVNQFYWSEKNGLLGWDEDISEWRLREKYVPQQRI